MSAARRHSGHNKIYLAIGDIHGCYQELDQLLSRLETRYNLSDVNVRMVFLGDYIDRGDSSMLVLQRLRKIGEKYPQTIFLKGNHEDSFLQEEHRTFNDIPTPTPSFITDFLESLKHYYETDSFLFVHGGPSYPEADLEEEKGYELLWNYMPDQAGWNGKIVVKGHTAVKKPTLYGKVLYMDTGCCFNGSLTCAVLSDDSGMVLDYVQIPRIKREELAA